MWQLENKTETKNFHILIFIFLCICCRDRCPLFFSLRKHTHYIAALSTAYSLHSRVHAVLCILQIEKRKSMLYVSGFRSNVYIYIYTVFINIHSRKGIFFLSVLFAVICWLCLDVPNEHLLFLFSEQCPVIFSVFGRDLEEYKEKKTTVKSIWYRFFCCSSLILYI